MPNVSNIISSRVQLTDPRTGSIRPEWFRFLESVRGVVDGAALTKTDDTNVTMTLGGSPTTALLAATSLTLGWTGVLAIARGGIGSATAGSNNIFAAPANGTTGGPLFRPMVNADLEDSGVVAATWGSAANAVTITVNSKGILTAATSNPIAISAAQITSGLLALARGGTTADLSATGGAGNYLKQSAIGAAITVGTIPASDITALSDIIGTSNQVNVANGTTRVVGGNVTLSLPQDIHTAASPIFTSLRLSSGLEVRSMTLATGVGVTIPAGYQSCVWGDYVIQGDLTVIGEFRVFN